jgi:predicted RNA-binding Zn-ribbon protein involved in translation (DUF1610 family)
MDMLYEALKCASVGLRVFPLYEVTERRLCSCWASDTCKQPGKHPRVKVWQEEATTSEDTIREWWTRWPDAGIGMATGRASGVWVLDLDGDEAITWYTEMVKVHGRAPTRGVLTGRGRHLYWTFPDGVEVRNKQKVDKRNVDVRGDGGFVILPPTRHHSGRHYEWRDQLPYQSAPAVPPEWLLELVKYRPPPPPPKIVNVPGRIPWTAKAADDEMARRLRLEPSARQLLAERLGVVTDQHARKVKCPKCGDRSVWWMIHGTGYAKCSHLNSCGWLGPLTSLLG